MPARASEEPASFRNPRRETGSSHSEAPFGNSRCMASRNSGLPASSSRLRQNSGAFLLSTSARNWTRSSLSFLPGQTSSRCALSFASWLFIGSMCAVPTGLDLLGRPPRAHNPWRTSSALEGSYGFTLPSPRLPPWAACLRPGPRRRSAASAFLSVARRATRNVHHRAHMVFPDQIRSQRQLIGEGLAVHDHRQIATWLLITHVEHLIARTQRLCRITMAADAPLHLQRGVIEHHRHAIDRPVAGVAANPLGHVNAVIEIHKIRQIVHPIPHQRFTTAEAFAYGFEDWRRSPNLRVAVHAGLGRRESGEARLFDRGVAVAAINAQGSYVVLMAEGRRLRPHNPSIGHVGRALKVDA